MKKKLSSQSNLFWGRVHSIATALLHSPDCTTTLDDMIRRALAEFPITESEAVSNLLTASELMFVDAWAPRVQNTAVYRASYAERIGQCNFWGDVVRVLRENASPTAAEVKP